jgi:hypothetical protein
MLKLHKNKLVVVGQELHSQPAHAKSQSDFVSLVH